MSTVIPFSEKTVRPTVIPGNETAEHPTEFDLAAVGGAARARLKSILLATSGIADLGAWTPEAQRNVIAAFETGAPVFAEGVAAVRGLTAPVALALKVGLIAEIPKGLTRQSQIPITTGYEFSRVATYMPALAYEVALELAEMSKSAEVDVRFFERLSGLLRATPASAPGSANTADQKPDVGGTAGSGTPPAAAATTT